MTVDNIFKHCAILKSLSSNFSLIGSNGQRNVWDYRMTIKEIIGQNNVSLAKINELKNGQAKKRPHQICIGASHI